jgi:hypothetical protein
MITRRSNNKDLESLDRFLVSHKENRMFVQSNMKRSGLEYQDKNYMESVGALDAS